MNKRLQNYKIVLFFSTKTKISYTICASILFFLLCLGNPSLAQKKQQEAQIIKTVCIDAGHGGKDPGCHGASANEKTVCLNMALKLGAKIKEAYPNINVVYTRDKDVFVELDDRAEFANKNKADLFICIHANSASPSAVGTETYVLGLHKTDAQKNVMDRENKSIELEDDKGAKYKEYKLTPETMIVHLLQQAINIDRAIVFASNLQNEFKKVGRYDRGVKQAGFLVLWKTTMPAVLIETGFLTNPQEEVFLSGTDSQDKMADAMFQAFQKYKNQVEGTSSDTKQEVVKTEKTDAQESIENKEKEVPKNTSDITFMVQIETSDSKIQLTSSRFKGLEVFEYKQDNFYKYAVGNFINDFNAAKSYQNEMREKGFQHAFVIAFQNGERIAMDQALKMIKK